MTRFEDLGSEISHHPREAGGDLVDARDPVRAVRHHQGGVAVAVDRRGERVERVVLAVHEPDRLVVGFVNAITDGVSPIHDPAGELQSYSLANGVLIAAGGDIKFDSLGRPMNGASLITAPQTWTLSGGASVTLQPVTGFVTVTP